MLFCFLGKMMRCKIKVDCSQPLYLAHTKENASEARTKHAEVGGRAGGVCDRDEQEEIESVDISGKSRLTFYFSRFPPPNQ